MKNKLLKVLPLGIAGLLMGVTSSGVFNTSTAVFAEGETNSTAEVNCNLGGTYAAYEIAYDGTATDVYGAQAYAGITGPAWFVGNQAGMASQGADSHAFGSNNGDGRNGLEVTFKFNSTVEGESFLKLYCQSDVHSPCKFTENGFTVDMNFSDFSTDLVEAWKSDVAKLIPVTVRKGINTYSFKMGDNYTMWMYAFGMDVIDARNESASLNGESITTANAPAIGYIGQLTKIYGLQANAKISGQSWLNDCVFDRLQDGSTSHGIGNNGWESWREGKNFKFEININSYVEGDAYIDLFVENRGYNPDGNAWRDGKFDLTHNDGEPVQLELNDLQPVDWNHNVATPVPVTLVKGANKFVFAFQDFYTGWFYGFRVGDRTVRKFHDVGGHNYLIRESAAPVTIDYSKGDTGIYGMQAYAGTEGQAWVATDVAPGVTEGYGSRKIGAMADKPEFSLIIAINSAAAQEVTLNIFVEYYIDASLEQYKAEVGCSYTLNDGEPVATNFYDINGGKKNCDEATPFDIELVEGLNTFKLTMPANIWKCWFGGFQILGSTISYDRVGIADWSNKVGDMGAGTDFVGLNAFDNSADYGKAGSVDYVFRTPEAAKYDIYLTVMAGNGLANRIEIKVNGVTQTIGDKPYLSCNTGCGWSGDSVNKVTLDLPQGIVTLTIGNSLTRVNDGKTEEVAEGGVLVSNWWMHNIEIEKTPVAEMVIDTTNAQTTYLPFRPFTAEGLSVKVIDHANGDAERVLTASDYTIDSSAFDSSKNGQYKIYVTETATELTGFYSVSVGGDQMVPYAGEVLEFDGVNTAAQAFYNAEVWGEGTDACEGRIAWINTGKKFTEPDTGFEIGSNGVGEWENRQICMKLHINSAVAGKFLISMYMLSEYSDNTAMTIKVNDGEAVTSNLFFCNYDVPYKMYVELVQGENIIEMKTQNCYRFWFKYYTVSLPTYEEVGTTVNAINCARWGNDIINCNNQDMWEATSEKRELTFFYNVAEAGSYELEMVTPSAAGKSADLYIDGVKNQTMSMANGATHVHFDLTAGNHVFTIAAQGTAGSFNLKSVKLTTYVSCTGLTLDTTDVTTEVEYDGLISYSLLGVTASFSDGSSRALTTAEYRVDEPVDFSTTVPGTYTFTVVYLADETITATFTITVLPEETSSEAPVSSEEPVVSSSEPVVESSEQPASSEAPASSEDPIAPVAKGCGGSIAACGLISFVALGAALILGSKKKEN